MKGQDIVFKEIRIGDSGMILCKSWNTQYVDFSIGFEDVFEIWEYYSFATVEIPTPTSDLNTILKSIESLKSELIKQKK